MASSRRSGARRSRRLLRCRGCLGYLTWHVRCAQGWRCDGCGHVAENSARDPEQGKVSHG
jgi:hypothetical protein